MLKPEPFAVGDVVQVVFDGPSRGQVGIVESIDYEGIVYVKYLFYQTHKPERPYTGKFLHRTSLRKLGHIKLEDIADV